MPFKQRRENIIEGSASGGGRIRAWETETEPDVISLAVVGDRAKLSPSEALDLAQWLVRAATGRDVEAVIKGMGSVTGRMSVTPPPATMSARREAWTRREADRMRQGVSDALHFERAMRGEQ